MNAPIASSEKAVGDYLKNSAPGRPVAEVLADVLRRRIMDGYYLPGQRLVEAELTKLYGVSRGPVREAIRWLMSEGLVEAEKHRSPTIKGVDREQFLQMFEVRAVLEGYAAGLVAGEGHGRGNNALAEEADRWRRGEFAEAGVFVAANTAFHDLIIGLANRPVLTAQVRQLAIPGYKGVFKPLIQPEEISRSTTEHIAILEAIVTGNAGAAEQAMREHVQYSGRRIAAKFSVAIFDHRLRELDRLRNEPDAMV